MAGSGNANAITTLTQDSSGRIWCGTYAGLFEMMSGHKFRHQPLPEQTAVSDLLEDRNHRLWVATPSGIDVLGEDGTARHIAIRDWTQNGRALALDGEGRVWAGTQGALPLKAKDAFVELVMASSPLKTRPILDAFMALVRENKRHL